MKVIELLNKIANGEEVPNKIKIETHIFTKFDYSKGDGTFVPNYESNNDGEYYINDFLYPQYLNDEIEIIEDTPKKIEKIKTKLFANDGIFINNDVINVKKINAVEAHIIRKLNEIIDYINKGDEK